MTQIQFHETYMGAQFYRKTLPELVKQLTRVADAMERLASLEGAASGQKEPAGGQEPEAPEGQTADRE